MNDTVNGQRHRVFELLDGTRKRQLKSKRRRIREGELDSVRAVCESEGRNDVRMRGHIERKKQSSRSKQRIAQTHGSPLKFKNEFDYRDRSYGNQGNSRERIYGYSERMAHTHQQPTTPHSRVPHRKIPLTFPNPKRSGAPSVRVLCGRVGMQEFRIAKLISYYVPNPSRIGRENIK